MRRWLYSDMPGWFRSCGLLLVRLVVGAAFVMHGWAKFSGPGGPMGWMGEQSPFPGVLLLAAATTELCGGIALILGLLTPVVSILLALTMAVAVSVHMGAGDPFVSTGGRSYELAAVYLVTSILYLLAGPGRFSLDAVLFGRSRPEAPR